MMKNKKNFPGMDGFVWWTGIVEGREDPLKLARVQVRIFGWHTEDKKMIPSEELLWAQPILSVNAYQTTHVPKEGEMVFGFFMDGEDAQHPFYMGVIPGIPQKEYVGEGFGDPGNTYDPTPNVTVSRVEKRPIPIHLNEPTTYPAKEDLDEPTTSRLARNENLDKTPVILSSARENNLEYDAKYPYNCSVMTESGHYFDLDDTPKNERIMLLHRTGSFIEFSSNGHIRIFSTNNIYMIANNDVYIQSLTKNITETAKINISETAQTGSIAETAKINITETASGNITETASGNIIETATTIRMN